MAGTRGTRGGATGDRTRTSVSIDKGLAERLRQAADERVMGPGLLAEKLIEDGLARLVPVTRLLLLSDEQSDGEHDTAGDHSEPAEGETS